MAIGLLELPRRPKHKDVVKIQDQEKIWDFKGILFKKNVMKVKVRTKVQGFTYFDTVCTVRNIFVKYIRVVLHIIGQEVGGGATYKGVSIYAIV